ncbi:MAG: hypothetical protein LJE59_12565 [Chromatiaceae bacterium]|jgi:hypothetical protein|nr:hypothetical protein [Chromatiaceae bacterium]
MKLLQLLLAFVLPAQLLAAQRLMYGEEPLELRGQARVCHLGLIKLYDIDYFRGPGADPNAARCVQLSYLREFSASALDRATRKVFRDLHGEQVAARYRGELQLAGLAYSAVDPGDRYTYCVEPGKAGVLLRDEREVIQFDSADFAERFLQIWVRAEDEARNPQWGFAPC